MKKYLLVFVLTVALVLVVVTAVAGAANTQTPDKLVMNITYKVLNNPDSGVAGNYWALDEMNRHVQVWQTGPTSYRAVVSDEGKFTTFVGTTSPGGTGTIASEVTGTLHGGYDATFDAPAVVDAKNGNLGTIDYEGDSSGNTPGYVSWLDTYFPGYSAFTQDPWGWTYHYQNQVWVNSSAGNSGDIVVP